MNISLLRDSMNRFAKNPDGSLDGSSIRPSLQPRIFVVRKDRTKPRNAPKPGGPILAYIICIISFNRKEKAMIVFVTGGTGFLGCEIVEALTEAGYETRVLARTNSSHGLSHLPTEAKRVRGDILSHDLEKFFSERTPLSTW